MGVTLAAVSSRGISLGETQINSSFRAERSGDLDSSGFYSIRYGLFTTFSVRALIWAFNALRALVLPLREWGKTGLIRVSLVVNASG